MKRLFAILLGIVREISDQAPYQRHLARHGITHSPVEWRRFIDARQKAKYARAKCC